MRDTGKSINWIANGAKEALAGPSACPFMLMSVTAWKTTVAPGATGRLPTSHAQVPIDNRWKLNVMASARVPKSAGIALGPPVA